ncbi:hypothetical protein RF11_04779 [Thelohanellus kitauei]|uniref:Uncharacterized protein n=1 Tax=Thelohanellus kitauei TaxID=669202 RepID=A0A0C2J0C4_THEKT|nr:hypothetical protein RF11_04779 [Thelohanellus kitauei]
MEPTSRMSTDYLAKMLILQGKSTTYINKLIDSCSFQGVETMHKTESITKRCVMTKFSISRLNSADCLKKFHYTLKMVSINPELRTNSSLIPLCEESVRAPRTVLAPWMRNYSVEIIMSCDGIDNLNISQRQNNSEIFKECRFAGNPRIAEPLFHLNERESSSITSAYSMGFYSQMEKSLSNCIQSIQVET